MSTKPPRSGAVACGYAMGAAAHQLRTLTGFPPGPNALPALDPEAVRLFDHVERSFVVTGETREFGLVHLLHRWG